MSELDDDPGWPFDWRVVVSMGVPVFILRRHRRADGDGLVALRQTVMSYIVGLVPFFLVSIARGARDVTPRQLYVAVACPVVAVFLRFVLERWRRLRRVWNGIRMGLGNRGFKAVASGESLRAGAAA
ncbi:MAG: hypothetical protein H0U92_12615 [Actinobacteria bacterium]|nr:hypothetical protein [Actinomycetota bacterium]